MENKKKTKYLHVLLAFILAAIVLCPASVSAASQKTPGKVSLQKISSSAYNKINIQWKKTSNATHYKIYYKPYGGKKWTGLATVSGNTTSYTHTASKSKPIVVGQKYTYTVKGYNSKYKTNGKYDAKGLTTYTKPTTVQLKKASLNSDKASVTVTWNKIGSGDRYVVFRKTPGSGWTRLATLTDKNITSYTDKHPVLGKTNTYIVRSYYSKTKVYGNYNSRGVSVNVPKPVVPGQPKLKKATAESYDRVKLTWNKASNATAYRIYYRTNGGSWKSAGDVDANTTSFIHKGLKENTKYTYTVKAYNKNSKKWGSYDKKGLTVKTPKIPTPSQPKLKSISASGTEITITWNKSSHATGGYRVYYRTEFDYGPKSWRVAGNVGPNTFTYTAHNLKPSTRYYFTVRAYSSEGKWSSYHPDGLSAKTGKEPENDIKVTRIELNATGIDLKVGQTYQLKTTVYPDNATNKKLKWVTTGDRVSVSDTGLVTGLKNGMTSVKAVATDGSGVKTSCEVVVSPSASIPEPDVTPTPQPIEEHTVQFLKFEGSISCYYKTTVKSGTVITMPEPPTWENHIFLGWFTDPNGGTKVTSLTVTKDVTLYAHWAWDQENGVENVTLAGGDTDILSVWYDEVSTPVDFSRVEFECQNGDIFDAIIKRNPTKYAKFEIQGLKKGTSKVFAKYNGKVIKTWNVTVTSDWPDYLEYTSWRKGVEAQIWNNSMSVTQKLDAAKSYLKTNYRYGSSGVKYIAYKTKSLDCISASDIFGDMAKDLGLQVKYYNERTGKAFDYIVDAYSTSDGHIYNLVMVNGKWVKYDASPMP